MKFRVMVVTALLTFLFFSQSTLGVIEWARSYLRFTIVNPAWYMGEMDRCFDLDEEISLCFTDTGTKYLILWVGEYGEVFEI